jgi:hypothetical protein
MKRFLLVVLAPLMLAACSPTAAVVRQASFDLACPENQIQVVELNMHTYGATGCEKRASYMAGCGLFGCTALVNGSPAANVTVQQQQQQAAQHH